MSQPPSEHNFTGEDIPNLFNESDNSQYPIESLLAQQHTDLETDDVGQNSGNLDGDTLDRWFPTAEDQTIFDYLESQFQFNGVHDNSQLNPQTMNLYIDTQNEAVGPLQNDVDSCTSQQLQRACDPQLPVTAAQYTSEESSRRPCLQNAFRSAYESHARGYTFGQSSPFAPSSNLQMSSNGHLDNQTS